MAQTSTSTTRSKSSKGAQDKKGAGNSPSRSGQGGGNSRQGSSSQNGRGQKTAGQSSGQQSASQRSASGNQPSASSRSSTSSNNTSRSAGENTGEKSFKGESYLEKFFLDMLKDIYYAEQKITQSLPKMKEAATTEELQEAFEDHLHQTERHVKRLEKVFQILGKRAEGKKCEAIEGIVKEAEDIISETEEGSMTRDAALIIAAQKVEHYEIATYGGLVQLAITMELHEAADILDKTLVEEEDTDARLTEIAENEINLGAEHEGNHYSWNQDSEENDEEDEDSSAK